MANSLHDQLMKAGLVDQKKVKQAKKEKYKQQKQQPKNHPEPTDEAKLAAQRAQAEKQERDRELNRQRQEEAQRRAVAAQIAQIIEQNQVSREGGETPYNFADGAKVKKIHVTAEQHRQLGNGRLAIVRQGESYQLVPADAAIKIRERDAACVIVLNASKEAPAEDDPYAAYQVPDDLMW